MAITISQPRADFIQDLAVPAGSRLVSWVASWGGSITPINYPNAAVYAGISASFYDGSRLIYETSPYIGMNEKRDFPAGLVCAVGILTVRMSATYFSETQYSLNVNFYVANVDVEPTELINAFGVPF